MNRRQASARTRRRLQVWAGLLLVVLCAPGLAVWLGSFALSLPGFAERRAQWVTSDAYLLDRHGAVLQTRRLDHSVRRLDWAPIEAISPALIDAVLLAEDRRFFAHGGIDLRALLGAGYGWLRDGRRRGASTLTMQLAGLLEPGINNDGKGKRWEQKLRQMAYALALERHWSKAQILEGYFNQVGFRGELQGLAATSQALFGKHPSGLGVTESMMLAALLPAPNATLPTLQARACAIAQASNRPALCPELATFMARTLAQPLRPEATVQQAPHLAQRLLRQPGQRLITTLDARWQRLALEALSLQLAGLAGQNVRDGAAIIADNRSGGILAYVGSAGSRSTAGQVDGAAARRQAGSTLKPFLYALALERRYLTPASLLNDSPVNLETASGLYIPQNYDRGFKGQVSVRTALAASLNVPAVRTLVLAGVERFRDRLVELGYSGLTHSGEYYGFSLALGSAEVSLLEQVNAYRTLANGGAWSPLRFQAGPAGTGVRQVISPEAAFLVADILSDGAARSVTFGLDSPLSTRFWSAVKTGTSKDMRDNWCIGFSPRYTVGVWVGNFEGDAMQAVSGVSGAAPAWAAIMAGLHGGSDHMAIPPPGGVVRQHIRFDPPIEPPRQEWFIAGTETEAIHAVGDDDTRRPTIETPPEGVIIALDPDIPAANQQIRFKASGAGQALWLLDRQPLGPADVSRTWSPQPGHHVLELQRRADGYILDRVSFQVRAPRP